MKILKKIFKALLYILFFIILVLIIICLWHHTSNLIEKKRINIPGDKISIYDNEYIHAVKLGKGDYTIVFLPGMGTSSPYYDYYKLASEVSKNYEVIIVEPLGYGFSSNTSKKRNLDNYEYELSKVLDYYKVKDNIILLGHSYSGISNMNYANKHHNVKGIICLDCTTAYQIETHVKDGKFTDEVPVTSSLYTLLSPIGLTRFAYKSIMAKDIYNSLLVDVPKEYQDSYKHLLYNKTMNKTIVNEIDDIPYNQLELLYNKYRNDLNVLTILSNKTIKDMKEYKKAGDFKRDWEEMHNLLISNDDIQHIYTLKGDHYIHHGNTNEIAKMINEMIKDIV